MLNPVYNTCAGQYSDTKDGSKLVYASIKIKYEFKILEMPL